MTHQDNRTRYDNEGKVGSVQTKAITKINVTYKKVKCPPLLYIFRPALSF
jgi:hypothetical protein